MNEDYLWDKTGGDARVEKLENALRTFSYKPSAPPEIPAKVFPLTEKSRRNFFKLGLALAFTSAVVVILSAAWLLLPNKNNTVDTESVKVIEPAHDTIVRPMETPSAPIVGSSVRNGPPVISKIRRVVRPSIQPINAVALNAKERQRPGKLTDEEKYAYSQLMLALSITGSKLKIVRDTIAGTEETKTIVEKGRNLYQK